MAFTLDEGALGVIGDRMVIGNVYDHHIVMTRWLQAKTTDSFGRQKEASDS